MTCEICKKEFNGKSSCCPDCIALITKTTEKENAHVKFTLARCYFYGEGLPQDKKQAIYWYNKAVESIVDEKKISEPQSHLQLKKKNSNLEAVLANMEGTWQQRLMQRIKKSGKRYAEIYKKAHISKQTFSKIKNGKTHSLSKETVLALAIALELDTEEANEFLAESGYAFSKINAVDVIVQDFISRKRYDIAEINDELSSLDLPPLGDERNTKDKNLKKR